MSNHKAVPRRTQKRRPRPVGGSHGPFSGLSNSFTITLQAGRSNNSAVAAAFNAAAGGQFQEYAADGQSVYESTTPSSLNFYFAVQINYDANGDVGSVVVYLGQGSYGSFIDPTNNWWIGGSAVSCVQIGSSNDGSIDLAGTVNISGNQDTIMFF